MHAKATNAAVDVGPAPIVAYKCHTSDALPMLDASLEVPATKPATVMAALECARCDPKRIEEPIDFVSSASFFVFGRGCSRVVQG